MPYYSSNALYEYIENNRITYLQFTRRNTWILIYGDNEGKPKVLLVVSAVKQDDLDCNLYSDEEQNAIRIALDLVERCKIPCRLLRYCAEKFDPNNAHVVDITQNRFESTNINFLLQFFYANGLKVAYQLPQKQINSQSSSAFHNWQRLTLGNEIAVSDIDLIGYWRDNAITIYELKRSYIELSKWQPFSQDYKNFRLVGNFATMVGADFELIYNQRTFGPGGQCLDNIDVLKIYSYDFAAKAFVNPSVVSLNDFINANY